MVLCRDEAPPSRCVSTRLIMTTVTIPNYVSELRGYLCMHNYVHEYMMCELTSS